MSNKNPRPSSNGGTTVVAVSRARNNEDGASTFNDNLLISMLSFRGGDFSARMPSNLTGVEGKIADAFNDIVMFNDRRAKETARVSKLVGNEGKLKQRMHVPEAL